MMKSMSLFAFAAAALAAAGAIDIDLGRQLFVDDHLVAAADGVARHWSLRTVSPPSLT